MNYSRKDLEDLYSGVAGKPIAQRKHLSVFGEAPDQQQLFRQLTGGKNKGAEVTIPTKDQAVGKYDVEDTKKISLTDEDIENFKTLNSEDQLRVKKYIESTAFRGLIQNSFKGSDDEVEEAFRLLMSSHLPADSIHSVIQDINTDRAVNTKLLSTVGNYTPGQIFSSDDAWEVYKILMPIGVGKLQQGPGEVAFAMMSPDVDESVKGDISINGELFELKVNGGRISDKAGPDAESIKSIMSKYFDENIMSYLNRSKQSLSLTEFTEWSNGIKRGSDQIDFEGCAREIFSSILSPEFTQPLAKLFGESQVDPKKAVELFKKQSFNWYKSTKTGGEGQWNKLIGINTKHSKGSIAVIETGDQFAMTPMQGSNPAIIRTKSGTRENYIEFKPIK